MIAERQPIVQFAIQTPDLDWAKHIDHALALDLPEADCRQKTLHLVANGPSARDLPCLHGDTMAVNGAIRLLEAPTYWIACDPQPLVADFLADPPHGTVYLAASKCHPSVFEALQGRMVRLWHVNDHPIARRTVPAAVSVTLCAMMLAMRMGYRTIHTYGWDCAYDGDHHHAGLGETLSEPVDIEVGEGDNTRWFKSTSTWCCEIEDAGKILPVLRWSGVEVVIHGDTMTAAIFPEYAARG